MEELRQQSKGKLSKADRRYEQGMSFVTSGHNRENMTSELAIADGVKFREEVQRVADSMRVGQTFDEALLNRYMWITGKVPITIFVEE